MELACAVESFRPRSKDHDLRDDQTVPHLQNTIDQATTYRNRRLPLW
jgi:hypothetical protein